MTTFEKANDYAMEQAEKLNKLTLNEFFTYIHANYYLDQDISFMNYFIELCDKEGQFVVPHTKLVEYGVMTSKRSSNVKEKLENLGLKNDENKKDYVLLDVQQNSKKGGRPAKLYTLTPEAFKICLMRAQHREGQSIDPVIYCDYYSLLEKVFKLFTDYERAYLNKLLSMKDDKIDKLTQKMEEQSNQMNKKIDKLLNYSNAITKQNVDLIERADHLQITADMTQEDLDKSLIYQKEILNHLVDKSYKSTMNPSNPDQVTHFAVLMPNKIYGRTILVRGQLKRVNAVVNKNSETHKLVIQTSYNANAINLVINVKEYYEDYRNTYIARYNIPIILHNDKLKVEISKYNKEIKKTNKPPRIYSEEKKPLLRINDNSTHSGTGFFETFPIKFGTTFISYTKNKHIKYKELINCIKEVNELTQKSPVGSDNES